MSHRVVIVGGGFAGLWAARSLRGKPLDVTLVDKRNFHLFQPLLYQVATGGLSPGDVSAPLRAVLKRGGNVRVLLGEVLDVDATRRQAILHDRALPYDTLIVAAGSAHHYFGHERWSAFAPGLKTVEDATTMRARILGAFEAAELETDPRRREALLTFVIVGAGPTGVELAGAIGELARHTLAREFRGFAPSSTRIVLVEAADRILSSFPERLSRRATASLRRLGVDPRTSTEVVEVSGEGVTLRAAGCIERLAAATVLWAAGVEASPLGVVLERRAGARLGRAGRVEVAPDCTLPGNPSILVLGDMAHLVQDGRPLPAVAPVAMQQGRYAARLITDRLAGRVTPPFRYRNRGQLAVIGRAAAVADLGRGLRFAGYPAWLLWLFVHILYLVEFENRLLVLIQWGFSYFTRKRGARLITEPS